ncbi:hypothetical protein ONZ45_g13000 [Pleurotus djamor]|nr:hypothetical protein ONZ45_g13000 [Pleurotus djamor]
MAELPNPNTPLAFLSPDLANQFEVSRYLYAITLGAYIWDCAVNLKNDYRLLFKMSIRFPTIVYYISRISTLAYIITSFVFQVGSVPNCQALQIALGVCNVFSQTFTSLLFLLRVLAVWNRNKYMKVMYTLLWLTVIACSITVPVGISGAHIGPTQHCINTRAEEYTESTGIIGLINDSLVFFGIAYRIMTYSVIEDNLGARTKTFFGGGSLSNLSRALLQGGQTYYLVAMMGNVILFILFKLPSLPPVYKVMCTIPVLAIVNAMACLVFRQIKFGLVSHDGTTIPTRTDGSSTANVLQPPFLRRRVGNGLDTSEIVIAKDTKVTDDTGIAIPLRTRMTGDTTTAHHSTRNTKEEKFDGDSIGRGDGDMAV